MVLKFDCTLLEDEIVEGQRIANDHLPKGRLWEAFSVPETSNFAISSAVGAMVALQLKYIEYLKRELNPYTTIDLIGEWEKSVKLPDKCSVNFVQNIYERRLQVILRLRRKPIVTSLDFSQIIKEITGFDVIIKPRSSNTNIFNHTFDGGESFDIAPFSTDKIDRFTFDVYVDYTEQSAFDVDEQFDGDYEFDGQLRPRIIECLIKRIKPANSIAVYHYSSILYEANL